MTFPLVPIKRVAHVRIGKMLQSTPVDESDICIPYLRAAHVQADGVLAEPQMRRMWFSADEALEHDLRQGDVVVVEGGVGGYGHAAYLSQSLPGWAFQNSIIRLRPTPGLADGRFIAYALQDARRQGLIRVACNAATIPHFTAEKLKAFRIPMPDCRTQELLADYLDREVSKVDALIGKQQRLIQMLKERRTAVHAHAAVRGLDSGVPMRDTGVPWLGEIPQHWAVRPLWSMFRRIKDVGHPDETMLSVFREFGVVEKDSRANNNATADNRDIYQLVHPGWLVTNRMKAWQGSVGISTTRGIVSGHYLCFAPKHGESHAFLNLLLRSQPYVNGYFALSRGVRPGQAEIDNDLYRLLPIALPPLDEQQRIVAYVDDQTGKIDALIQKSTQFVLLAKERRAALITAAVSGKIDVRKAA